MTRQVCAFIQCLQADKDGRTDGLLISTDSIPRTLFSSILFIKFFHRLSNITSFYLSPLSSPYGPVFIPISPSTSLEIPIYPYILLSIPIPHFLNLSLSLCLCPNTPFHSPLSQWLILFPSLPYFHTSLSHPTSIPTSFLPYVIPLFIHRDHSTTFTLSNRYRHQPYFTYKDQPDTGVFHVSFRLIIFTDSSPQLAYESGFKMDMKQ